MALPRYAIVSPVRDEEQYIRATLDSIVGQTVLPDMWIIVDDGSSDRTSDIVAEYMQQHPWICLITRKDRGYYKLGGGVVDAFTEGLAHVDLDSVEFICKLDADLRMEPGYFEQLLRHGVEDPKLGIISGVTYIVQGDRLIRESVPMDYAVGMGKFWRVACFRQINGLVASLGWDVLDVIRAQMRGWKTRSYPELIMIHLRPMSSRHNWYKGRVRNGLTDYVLGYHPLFELGRCLYRMTYPPYILGGAFMLFGYVQGAIRGEKRIVTADEKRYLQRQQLNRLYRLKLR